MMFPLLCTNVKSLFLTAGKLRGKNVCKNIKVRIRIWTTEVRYIVKSN
jgi:hypothetical protein